MWFWCGDSGDSSGKVKCGGELEVVEDGGVVVQVVEDGGVVVVQEKMF